MSNQNSKYFQHFLICYFNISADYSDLKKVINFYNCTEKEETRSGLRKEIETFIQMEDWEYVQKLVKEHGMRNITIEKIKDMTLLMKDMLE